MARDMGETTAAEASRRLSPAEAVDLMNAAGVSDVAAAAALTDGMRDGSCPLWCDGRRVPSHFVVTLAVEIDDRTGAVGITSLTREPWDKPRDAYDWRFDARSVRDLLSSSSSSSSDTSPAPPPPSLPGSISLPAALARQASEASLRNCVLAIVKEHAEQHPGKPPLADSALWREVERRLDAKVARDRVLAIRDEVAPQFKLGVGRPRKDA